MRWYRVFAGREEAPGADAVENWFRSHDPSAQAVFDGDDLGWYRAQSAGAAGEIRIERYLTREEGIRNELNTWAAWLESLGERPNTVDLMRHIIETRQLFTVRSETGSDSLCESFCRWLGSQVDGIYQADGQGFFAADGTLLVAEDG
jgi:hypothetical protein